MFGAKLHIGTMGSILVLALLFGSCSQSSVLHSNFRKAQKSPALSLQNHGPHSISGSDSLEKENALRIRAFKSDPSKERFTPVKINHLQYKYAEKLGVEPLDIRNLSLYGFIDYWYGVRYKYGGVDEKGIDCSAFVQRLYDRVFCTDLFRTAIEQFRSCKLEMSLDSLVEGDLVFFRTKGRRISHVGIYLNNGYFVHASYSNGVTISNIHSRYWSRIFAGAGQIKEVPSIGRL